MKIPSALAAVAATVVLCGCSVVQNAHSQKADMMAALMRGDNNAVMEELDYRLREPAWYNSSVVNTGDELMWRLEAGGMNLHLGRYKESLREFRIAEKLIGEYDDRASVSARDLGAEAGAAITNMNALPYRGFCRDRMMLAVAKALAYLGAGREDAFRAQLHRLRTEQKKIQNDFRKFFEEEKARLDKERKKNPDAAQKASSAAKQINSSENREYNEGMAEVRRTAHRGYGNFLNPAALYLSALGALRDGNFDNARIDFERLHQALPDNETFRSYLATATRLAGRGLPEDLRNAAPFDFPVDRDCVYVLFANGRSAALKQIAIYVPIMTAWPMCEFYPAPFTGLAVTANGRRYVTTPLADMDGILAQEYQERLAGMIARIVISTLIKEAAYYGGIVAISQANMDSTAKAVALAGVAVGGAVYRAATNTADTRTWEILPKEIQLTQLPMPADRQITLELPGAAAQTIRIPAQCRSAILLVSAPAPGNITCHVLPMTQQ